MDITRLILAQAEVPAPVVPEGSEVVTNEQSVPSTFFVDLSIDEFWQSIAKVSWLEAAICVAFATIYLIYGWRVFRVLVVLNVTVIGMLIGRELGGRIGSGLWGGIIGTVILGALSLPFMKYSVSVLGALAGAVLGGAIWRAGSLPDPLIWSGALAGLVAGGFLAFSSFRVSIMLFTSLQGAVFFTIGILALLNGYPNMSNYLSNAVINQVFLLPGLLIIPTMCGIVLQQKMSKGESSWAMPSTEGFKRK